VTTRAHKHKRGARSPRARHAHHLRRRAGLRAVRAHGAGEGARVHSPSCTCGFTPPLQQAAQLYERIVSAGRPSASRTSA